MYVKLTIEHPKNVINSAFFGYAYLWKDGKILQKMV